MNQILHKGKIIIKLTTFVRAGSLCLNIRLLVILLLGFISENILFSQTYLLNSASNGTTINTCSGIFYDSGGQGGFYSSNENYTLTFCSNNSRPIRFDFTFFDSRPSDVLYVYDGPNTGSPLIGQFSGVPVVPFSVTSSGNMSDLQICIRFIV